MASPERVLQRDEPAGEDATAREVEALHARYSRRVYGFCLSRLGAPEDAEEATQDTFLSAWRSLSRGQRPDAPLPWLLTVARNRCISEQRARSSRPAGVPLDERSAPSAPEPQAGEAAMLARAVAELPEPQRRAFVLREWRGLSYEEIGEELDLSYSGVAMQLFRARRNLAEALRDRLLRQIDRVRSFVGGPLLGGLGSGLGGAPAPGAAAAAAMVVAVGTLGVLAPGDAAERPGPSPAGTGPSEIVVPVGPPGSSRDAVEALLRSAPVPETEGRPPVAQPRTFAVSHRTRGGDGERGDREEEAGSSAVPPPISVAAPVEDSVAAIAVVDPGVGKTGAQADLVVDAVTSGPGGGAGRGDDGQSAAAGGESGGSPGQGGDPPGQGGDPPGQGGDPPGQGGDPPGQGGGSAGQGGDPPGQGGGSAGQGSDPPGQGGGFQGQGGDPPGQGGDPPGQGGGFQGQGGDPPGQGGGSAGQGGDPPGQGGGSAGQGRD